MDIFIGILTAVEVIVSLLLILVVLMQRPRQEGLGASFGDAAASQVWGAQTTNVLQKFTVYLAIILFALTTLFSLITLPVEINASKRALVWLNDTGITNYETHPMAKDALKSAAYTYFVAAISSLATLFYYITLFSRRR